MPGAEHQVRTIAAGRGRLLVLAAVVLAAGGLQVATARAAPAANAAFVRVNQVGYPTTAAKRAYLMSNVPETGATFTVTNATGTVLTGPVGANLGAWSNSFKNVYALDFDAVTTAGSYTISVTGPVAATSPAFRIDTEADRLCGAAGQCALLLPDRARRPQLHPQCPAQRPRASE